MTTAGWATLFRSWLWAAFERIHIWHLERELRRLRALDTKHPCRYRQDISRCERDLMKLKAQRDIL